MFNSTRVKKEYEMSNPKNTYNWTKDDMFRHKHQVQIDEGNRNNQHEDDSRRFEFYAL